VLDEATSALDLDTEACVLRNLSQEFPNTTTIIIAHRESTIRLADQVIHMKKGRVEGRVSQNDCDPISKHPSDQEKYLFERPTQIDQST
jgi:ABC-type bacteriocin/lantibiotic exporter with double-glycine peptidase domain